MTSHSAMPKKTAKKSTKKAVKKTSRQAEPGLSFGNVVHSVSHLHTEFLRQATKAVNVGLTLRNWFIGTYIHEYELHGADRAQYGENILSEFADTLTEMGIPSCDYSSLYKYRRFFQFYPQIFQTLTGKLQTFGISQVMQNSIVGSLTPQ